MIKRHLAAIYDLHEQLESLEKTVQELPEGKEKHVLEHLVQQMQVTTYAYHDNSLDLYDLVLDFAVGVTNA